MEERWIISSDYSSSTNERLVARRELSQAMIPGVHLLKVEIEKLDFENRVRPILDNKDPSKVHS